jgi:group I intron endonuclease
MIKIGIYIFTNKINGKVYIGQSKDIDRRYRRHISKLKSGNNTQHFQAAWNKYGSESFSFEILLECSLEQLDLWENYYIDLFQSWKRDKGYNINKSAEGPGQCSEETKIRISNSMCGRIHKEETKTKISETMKGIKHSDEHVENMSNALKGRSLSEESRQKISDTMKGRVSLLKGREFSEEHKRKISESKRKRDNERRCLASGTSLL